MGALLRCRGRRAVTAKHDVNSRDPAHLHCRGVRAVTARHRDHGQRNKRSRLRNEECFGV
eukprot:12152318-Heterocapsa_arctica.AAC.1